jgi:enoyl-CoA hydratase/carnithine racemase
MYSFENVRVEIEGAVAVVTIDRPQVLNALNTATLADLRHVMLGLQRDDGVRAIVITHRRSRRRSLASSPAPRT